MSDLQPCPFCGGTDLEDYGPDYPQAAWVTCRTCHATGPQVVSRAGADPRAAWNNRAIPPEIELKPVLGKTIGHITGGVFVPVEPENAEAVAAPCLACNGMGWHFDIFGESIRCQECFWSEK